MFTLYADPQAHTPFHPNRKGMYAYIHIVCNLERQLYRTRVHG